ncbi:MAG: type III pantothenate kinase [Oscillospiraceae bacterium]|jgi:type III pantothenate kinase|nr:type III pantothenate kinase [Oscillospiraceae bacterium]
MILAVDIGNTNIVLGCIDGQTIALQARLATELQKTPDQYAAELKMMLDLYGVSPSAITGSIISSVVPPVSNNVYAAIARLTGQESLVVGPGIRTGLNIRMDNSNEVGSDLITAAVAAIEEYGAPLMIVDMGTATTITAVDASGAFAGGCICPGIQISMAALTGSTAQLTGISLEAPKKAIGKNTRDAMRSGIVLGAAAMLDGLLDHIEQELGQRAKTIVTGGSSKVILPLCRREMIYDPNLMLKGLALLYRRNGRT